MNLDLSLPKVSVFIPAYNQENYVCDCLDSVLAQDYPHLEIVIGDDASTDNTPRILQDYQRMYPDKIKLFLNEKNLGITENCNKILALCTGKYIALIGGDDILLPGKITKQVNYMESNPDCVLTYHNAEVFFSEEENKEEYLYYDLVDPKLCMERVIHEIPFPICPVSTMVRREAIPKAGFLNTLPTISDRMFFFQVLQKGSSYYIDEVLVRYRKRKDGASRSIPLSERMLFFFLIERRYPRYWRASLKGYGIIYYRMAKKFSQKKRFRLALLYAWRSLIRGACFEENKKLIIEIIKSKFSKK